MPQARTDLVTNFESGAVSRLKTVRKTIFLIYSTIKVNVEIRLWSSLPTKEFYYWNEGIFREAVNYNHKLPIIRSA